MVEWFPCWNGVYRKILSNSHTRSVKEVIYTSTGFMHDLLWMHLVQNVDDCIKFIYMLPPCAVDDCSAEILLLCE